MDDIIQNKNLGEVAISNDVILSIISRSISELEGIKEFSSTKKSKLIGIGSKGKEPKISIEKDDENQLIINIPLSVKYGISIGEVSRYLKEKILREIQGKLGIKVKEIDIEVLGIEK